MTNWRIASANTRAERMCPKCYVYHTIGAAMLI